MMRSDDLPDGFWSALAPRDSSDSYEEATRWLRELNPVSDSDTWIFGSMRNLRAPLVDQKPREVLPGVRSFDPRGGDQDLMVFQKVLTEKLNSRLTPGCDENGFVGANGVHKNFDSLMTVGGYCSTPMSIMPVDNAAYSDSLGLPNGFRNPRHKEIFHELFGLIFGNYKVTSLKVPKLSTAGFPTGTSDPVWKNRCGRWVIENCDDLLPYFAKKDFAGLATDYGLIRCYKQQKRTQVDPPGKVRWANNMAYAISGGRGGEQVKVDKSVVIANKRYDEYSALRVRIIHGAPWLSNILPQCVSTGCLYAMFEWGAETFHHTNMNAIAEKIEKCGDAVFSDISNYDNSMREFIIREAHIVARKFFTEEVIDWSEDMFFAPYFSQPIDYAFEDGKNVAKSKPFFMGRPFDPKSKVVCGNRSGHAMTSLMAKGVKVWDTLCVIDDLYGNVCGNVLKYIEHKMPLKIVNNGDDEGLIGPKDQIDRFRRYRFNKDSNPGYFVAEPEVGQVFSGFMFMRSGGSVKAVPRLHSTLEKLYIPERSIGGNMRPFWPIGFEQRLLLDTLTSADYEPNPSIGVLLDIHASSWSQVMAKKYGSLVDILINGKVHMPIPVDTGRFTRIDYEVLEDPSKLIYKYKDSDVSKEVLAIVAGSNIQQQYTESFANRHFSGNLM